MNIQFRCDQCSREVNAPPQMSGKQAACPFCRAVLNVPVTPAIAPHEIREFIDTELVDPADDFDAPMKSAQGGENSAGAAGEAVLSIARAGSRTGRRRSATGMVANLNAIPDSATGTDQQAQGEGGIPDALWYVRPDSGGQFGPASSVLLKQWKTEGRVGPESWLWRSGWENWRPASSVFPELADNAPQILAGASESPKPGRSVEARINWIRNRRARSRFLAVALVIGVLLAISLVAVMLIVAGKGPSV